MSSEADGLAMMGWDEGGREEGFQSARCKCIRLFLCSAVQPNLLPPLPSRNPPAESVKMDDLRRRSLFALA